MSPRLQPISSRSGGPSAGDVARSSVKIGKRITDRSAHASTANKPEVAARRGGLVIETWTSVRMPIQWWPRRTRALMCALIGALAFVLVSFFCAPMARVALDHSAPPLSVTSGPRAPASVSASASARRAAVAHRNPTASSEGGSRAKERDGDIEAPAVLRLTDWAEQSGLVIDRLKPRARARTARPASAALVVSLSAHGSYGAVVSWVRRFEQPPRVASIQRLVIKRVSGERRGAGPYPSARHASERGVTERHATERHATGARVTEADAAEHHSNGTHSNGTHSIEPGTAPGLPPGFATAPSVLSLDVDFELATPSYANRSETEADAPEASVRTASWTKPRDVRDPFEVRELMVQKIAGRIRGHDREVKLVIDGSDGMAVERGIAADTETTDLTEPTEPAFTDETARDVSTDAATYVDAYPTPSVSEGQTP